MAVSPPTPEQLADLLASPPPRLVPREFYQAAMRQSATGVLIIFGLFFGGIGLFFAWIFFPWNFWQDWQLKDAPVAPGHVLSVTPTKLSIGKRNGRVYEYEFEFAPPAGAKTRGQCYTTAQRWVAGATVSVRFLADAPSRCCIDGARLSQGDMHSLAVLIFPLVGGTMAGLALRTRRRMQRLLSQGTVAEATVTGIEPTNVQINRQRVYKIDLRLTAADTAGNATLECRYYQPMLLAFARHRYTNTQPVFVLYDPFRPKQVLLPEALLES